MLTTGISVSDNFLRKLSANTEPEVASAGTKARRCLWNLLGSVLTNLTNNVKCSVRLTSEVQSVTMI